MKAYEKAYKLRMKKQDEMNWMIGMYIQSAVFCAVEHCLSGKDAKSEYIEKPFLQRDEAETGEKKDPESNEIIAVIEMKQRIEKLRRSGFPESPN